MAHEKHLTRPDNPKFQKKTNCQQTDRPPDPEVQWPMCAPVTDPPPQTVVKSKETAAQPAVAVEAEHVTELAPNVGQGQVSVA